MIQASVRIDHSRTLGTIDPMIYGQYLEHVQPEHHCIYGAIVDEPSSLTDERGYRHDVIAAVRELGVPVVRWPGGCFADIYHWEDGIGPQDQRPARRNWHWHGVEPNTFGTNEFLDWTEAVGARPYLNFNIGTGTLDEAIRWLDYCNGTEPTAEVRKRQANGRDEPWKVPYWGVGNEQWGPWEANAMDAETYAERLRNWTQFLKKLDPDAEFMGIASHSANDPAWDMHVLLTAGHLIDWITLHAYGHSVVGDADDYYPTVNFGVFFEQRLERLIHVIKAAESALGRTRPIRISVDEWNIRHLTRRDDDSKPELDRLSPRTMQDAVAAAGVLHAMLRHPEQVGMANYVFLFNGNGVLLTNPDGLVRTPLYDLFWLYRHLMIGEAVEARVTVETLPLPVRVDRTGADETWDVAPVDVVATMVDGCARYGIVNRHQSEPATVTFEGTSTGNALLYLLTHDDPLASNTFAAPDTIRRRQEPIEWAGSLVVPPHSIAVVERLSAEQAPG